MTEALTENPDVVGSCAGCCPDLRGICLSGYGMEHDLAACREAGFAEHLTKPVDIHRLHASIARVLNGETAGK